MASAKIKKNLNQFDDDVFVPLCVDLDGTLLKTDTLMESILVFVKYRPWNIFRCLYWALKGRSFLKQMVAEQVDLEMETLPKNEAFFAFLEKEREKGRTLILATAANVKIAQQTEMHFKLFSDVMASDEQLNLKGKAKLSALLEHFGDAGFDYAGDSKCDMAIWAHARQALVVNPGMGVKNETKKLPNVTRIFDEPPGLLGAVLNGVRVRQWPKNLLLFVPLVMSQNLLNVRMLFNAAIAFGCFCLCASSLYVVNDLLDLNADRRHPSKYLRPFASGGLSIISGVNISLVFLAVALVGALLLPLPFIYFLGLYGVSSFLYSVYLKNIAIVDVLLLSGLYTLRILAGGIATTTPISFWLLSFSMFIFFSLAILKRYAELFPMSRNGNVQKIAGRGYWTKDIETLQILGVTSGYLSVLVMALYINSDQVTVLYQKPTMLWALCPLLMFWISRIWLLAGRGQVDEDPVLFAIKDKVSLIVGVLTLIVILVAV